MSKTCPQCGAPLPDNATECKYCGETFAQTASQPNNNYYSQYQQAPPQQPYQDPNVQQMVNDGINPAWPIKNKIVAGVLALLVGGLGIHLFYLGKTGTGILFLVFCWTGIPSLIAFVQGIIYLTSSDHNFAVKHQVRLQ